MNEEEFRVRKLSLIYIINFLNSEFRQAQNRVKEIDLEAKRYENELALLKKDFEKGCLKTK